MQTCPRFSIHYGLRRLPALIALLSVSIGTILAGAQEMQPDPAKALAEVTQAAKTVTTSATKKKEAANTLITALNLSSEGLTLNPESIAKLKAGSDALKKEPAGGQSGLYPTIKNLLYAPPPAMPAPPPAQTPPAPPAATPPTPEPGPLPKALKALSDEITKYENGTHKLAKTAKEDAAKAKKEAEDKLEALKKAEKPDMAAITAAEKELETKTKAVQDAESAFTKADTALTEAKAAQTALQTLIDDLKAIYGEGGKNGTLQKATAAFFTYGKGLAAKHKALVDGSGFPGLLTEEPGTIVQRLVGKSPSDPDASTLLAQWLVRFGPAEQLGRPLRAAIQPIQKSADPKSDGAKQIQDDLIPVEFVKEGEARDAGMCRAIAEQAARVDDTVAAFPLRFGELRAECTRLANVLTQYAREFRIELRNFFREAGKGEADEPFRRPLPETEDRTLALTLLANLRQMALQWPVLAAQINEVEAYRNSVVAANQMVVDLGAGILVLVGADQGLEETLVGDQDHFVNEQVRLFYFHNVPRLMQTLNKDTYILNPEGRLAKEEADRRYQELRQLEQEVFELRAQIAGIRRAMLIREEDIRQKGISLRRVTKQLADAKDELQTLQKREADLNAEKGKANADLMKQQTEATDAKAKSDAAPDDAALKVAAEKEAADVVNATKVAADATAEATRATALVSTQQTSVTDLTGKQSSQSTALEEAKGEQGDAEDSLKKLSTKVVELQAQEQSRNSSIVRDAVAEAEAFGEAADRTPIYFAPARGGSLDPVRRVMMYAYGDSKTLFVRGLPEDVEKVLEIIAGFDRPAPQARVTLWTLQMSSRDPSAINGRMRLINESLRYLRTDIVSIQDVLRNSVNKEVNEVAQGIRAVTRGTNLDLDNRLYRYFFYPREIRVQLGMRLPYDEFWTTTSVAVRLEKDLDSLAGLVKSVQATNDRILKLRAIRNSGTDTGRYGNLGKELDALEEERRTLDALAASAFEEASKSLERLEANLTYLAAPESSVAQQLTLAHNLRNALPITQKGNAKKAISQSQLQEQVATANKTRNDLLEKLTRPSIRGLYSERKEQQVRTDDPLWLSALRSTTARLRVLRDQVRNKLKSDRPTCSEHPNLRTAEARDCAFKGGYDAFEVDVRSAVGYARDVRDLLSIVAQLLPPKKDELQDVTQVTRWTLPDPAHSTTLGETMFVLSLGRRSCRTAILRDFARELMKARALTANAKPSGDNHDDRMAMEERSEQYRTFLQDNLQVLKALGAANQSLMPAAVSAQSRIASADLMPAFPALPKILFGALNGPTTRLNDDELTANQHEILLAVHAKARDAVQGEVRGLVRQIGRTIRFSGKPGAEENPVTQGYRKRYLPLVGWLDWDGQYNSPQGAVLHSARTPAPHPPFSKIGKTVIKFPTDRGAAADHWRSADRLAWTLADNEGQRNTLIRATARVAAVDDMIKRMMVVMEDDLDHYFVSPTLKYLQDAIHDRPSAGTRLGEKLGGIFGKTAPRVNLGLIERTSILATNRLVARVDPNANADVTLDGPEDFLLQAQQLGQLAQGVNNSFFAPKKVQNGVGAAASAAGAAKVAGASAAALGPIAGVMGLLSMLEEQPKETPGEVYALNTGNLFKVTPIFDPSGQALRFKFDYAATVRVREPDGTTNPTIPRVDRHTVNTEVQLSNLEVREISRFGVNAQLGLPERRTGGIPFIKELPILKDIPLLGYFTRQAAKGGVVQESVILGQTAVYPTVAEIVDLLVDVPLRAEIGEGPPDYLVDKPTADPGASGSGQHSTGHSGGKVSPPPPTAPSAPTPTTHSEAVSDTLVQAQKAVTNATDIQREADGEKSQAAAEVLRLRGEQPQDEEQRTHVDDMVRLLTGREDAARKKLGDAERGLRAAQTEVECAKKAPLPGRTKRLATAQLMLKNAAASLQNAHTIHACAQAELEKWRQALGKWDACRKQSDVAQTTVDLWANGTGEATKDARANLDLANASVKAVEEWKKAGDAAAKAAECEATARKLRETLEGLRKVGTLRGAGGEMALLQARQAHDKALADHNQATADELRARLLAEDAEKKWTQSAAKAAASLAASRLLHSATDKATGMLNGLRKDAQQSAPPNPTP